jgi:CRP-like cAMP-binding protein
VVLQEGDAGDTFHVIASGRAAVLVGGVPRRDLGVGDGFGEIALLHDTPRTATVVARGGDLCTLVLTRADFLDAVLAVPASSAAARQVAGSRLVADTVADGRCLHG